MVTIRKPQRFLNSLESFEPANTNNRKSYSDSRDDQASP